MLNEGKKRKPGVKGLTHSVSCSRLVGDLLCRDLSLDKVTNILRFSAVGGTEVSNKYSSSSISCAAVDMSINIFRSCSDWKGCWPVFATSVDSVNNRDKSVEEDVSPDPGQSCNADISGSNCSLLLIL